MRKTAVILYITSLLLYSCNQNKPTSQIPVVGEAIDSIAIAQDTIEQKIMESSYEYAQTLIVSPKLAYDVRAYGGPPTQGEYCIIRRGADNKPDTVVQNERFGIIVNCFSGDLNRNGKEEIYITTRKAFAGAPCHLVAFEFDKNGTASAIDFGDSSKSESINTRQNNDSLHPMSDTIYQAGEQILKSSPFYNAQNSKYQVLLQSYRLTGNKCLLVREANMDLDTVKYKYLIQKK